MIGMAWMWKWNPQNAKDKGLAQAQKAQDSSFYILVIQDHIESLGKANTIKVKHSYPVNAPVD